MRAFLRPALLLASLASTTVYAQDAPLARERVQACDPIVATQAAREILNDSKSWNQPLDMFMPAFVLFKGGRKDQALFWFYAAQLRARYQLAYT